MALKIEGTPASEINQRKRKKKKLHTAKPCHTNSLFINSNETRRVILGLK